MPWCLYFRHFLPPGCPKLISRLALHLAPMRSNPRMIPMVSVAPHLRHPNAPIPQVLKKREGLPVCALVGELCVYMPAHIPKASDTSRDSRGLIVDRCQGTRGQMRKESSRHLDECKAVARLLHGGRGVCLLPKASFHHHDGVGTRVELGSQSALTSSTSSILCTK